MATIDHYDDWTEFETNEEIEEWLQSMQVLLEDAQNEEDEAAARVASIEEDMEHAQRFLDGGGHES